MSGLDVAFKRHSRAQAFNVHGAAQRKMPVSNLAVPEPTLPKEGAVRRSRVLNAQRTPSWLPAPTLGLQAVDTVAEGGPKDSLAREVTPRAPIPQPPVSLVPRSQWIDYVKLGTLVQGSRSLLICSSRVGRKLVMLQKVTNGANDNRERMATVHHRHIAMVSFYIATDIDSYMAYPYVRYTLEELLNTHTPMDEDHIKAVTLPVVYYHPLVKDDC